MTPKKRILHLEDLPEWIDIVQKALDGYEVYSARTLRQAVDLYGEKEEFDAAIIDISLIPGDARDIQGERFMKALEGLRILPGKRIIILSAYLTGLENLGRTRKYFKYYDVMDAIPKQKFDSKEFREIVDDAVRMPNVLEGGE